MPDTNLEIEFTQAPPPAAMSEGGSAIRDLIARAVIDPSIDLDRVERLAALDERMQSRQARLSFDAAMEATQKEMGPVRADATNPETQSKYASYGALDDAIRPIYQRHGFSLSFATGERAPEDHVRVTCRVAHCSGHREHPFLDMPIDGRDAKDVDVMTWTHATGSALTYAKRYLLGMIFNIVVNYDDDGNAASAGKAGGGTDFRPERRGGSNWVEESRRDGTLNQDRPKGQLAAPAAAPAPAESPATARGRKFVDNAIALFGMPGQTVEALSTWWDENEKVNPGAKVSPLAWLENEAPAEYARLVETFEEAREIASARERS